MTLATGTRLGRYCIERLVGVGGMGEVYSARDEALGRRVAIKVLSPDRTSREYWQRFQREAEAGALLSHPNICTVFDVGTEGNVRFLVMEYLEGDTLARRIGRGPLPIPEAVTYAVQAASALAAAHNNGIVHRDVKPGNMMLTANGLKLLDFGLSRLAPRVTETTQPPPYDARTEVPPTAKGTVIGTVAYMSPEQLNGDPVDHRADIYSFGAVLHELMTGRPPFDQADRIELTSAILCREPVRLRTLRPDVPAAIEAVAQKCLAKHPSDRYQRIEDVLPILQGVTASRPKRSRASSRASSARKQIHAVAVLPFRLMGAPADSDYLADGMTELLIARVAGITGLRVISRTSVMQYRGTTEPLRTIAARLDVDAVIEGSVVMVGDRLRITVHLIDVARDATIWADSFDRSLTDILAIQSEIADEIAKRVGANLSPTEQSALRRWARVPPAAQDAYLRARYLWNLHDPASLTKSFEYFMSALALAPEYAAIHSGLADWYQTAAMFRIVNQAEAIANGQAAAERAIGMDPRLADAHASLGRLRCLDWNWRGAEAEFLLALRYNANTVNAHIWYGQYLSFVGRHDVAIDHMRQAVSLDPLNARTIEGVGVILYTARQFDAAIVECSRAIELNRNAPIAHYIRALSLMFQRQCDRALADLDVAEEQLGSQHASVLVGRACCLHAAGRTSEAAALLDLLGTSGASSYDIAEGFAGCGRIEEGLTQLELALVDHRPELAGIARDPLFDSVAADPRFAAIVARVGIPTS